MERKIHEELKKLNKDVALYAIGHLVNEVLEKYKANSDVTAYLRDVQNDILENVSQFVKVRGASAESVPVALDEGSPVQEVRG